MNRTTKVRLVLVGVMFALKAGMYFMFNDGTAGGAVVGVGLGFLWFLCSFALIYANDL